MVVRRGGVKGVELLNVFCEMIQRDRAISVGAVLGDGGADIVGRVRSSSL